MEQLGQRLDSWIGPFVVLATAGVAWSVLPLLAKRNARSEDALRSMAIMTFISALVGMVSLLIAHESLKLVMPEDQSQIRDIIVSEGRYVRTQRVEEPTALWDDDAIII